MLKKLFIFLRNTFLGSDIKYSSGFWSALVRDTAEKFITVTSGKVVDLGCGQGLFLTALSIKNPMAQIVGLDISPDSVKLSKNILGNGYKNATVEEGNALKTRFSSETVDALYCLNTILHFSNAQAEQLLEEARRILKSSGTFMFDIRNLSNPFMMFQYKFRKYYDSADLDVVRAFHPSEISAMLAKHGFEVIAIHNMGFLSALKLFVVRKK